MASRAGGRITLFLKREPNFGLCVRQIKILLIYFTTIKLENSNSFFLFLLAFLINTIPYNDNLLYELIKKPLIYFDAWGGDYYQYY